MIDNNTLSEYRKVRTSNVLLPAVVALSIARSETRSLPDGTEIESAGERMTFMCDGFNIRIRARIESHAPKDGDYGQYVEACRYSEHDKPAQETPMGLPVAHFRYPSRERHSFPYFYPDYVEDMFNDYRAHGCSKSVARDMIVSWLEDWIGRLPDLVYVDIIVTAYRNGIELASTSLGSSFFDYDHTEIFRTAEDHGMIDDVIEDARKALEGLCECQ